MVTEVVIPVFDDCQPSAVSAIVEALSVANLHWTTVNGEDRPPFEWRTVSRDGRPVRTMAGLNLAADSALEQLGRPDLIFVPAIRSNDTQAMRDSIREMNEVWGGPLREHHEKGRYLAANCSAVFLLAETGLLDRRKATTSWWLSSHFQHAYPQVRLTPELLVTEEDRIYCAAAFSACFNLGLEIIARFLGPRAAISCAQVMLIDINRSAQLPYVGTHELARHSDDLVLRAQSMLLADLRNPARPEKLAERLRVTSRTLNRRFKTAIGETPLEFLQKARVERAKRLLETTDLSVDEIVHRVGYADASSFRRLFNRITSISPLEYRRRFRIQRSDTDGET